MESLDHESIQTKKKESPSTSNRVDIETVSNQGTCWTVSSSKGDAILFSSSEEDPTPKEKKVSFFFRSSFDEVDLSLFLSIPLVRRESSPGTIASLLLPRCVRATWHRSIVSHTHTQTKHKKKEKEQMERHPLSPLLPLVSKRTILFSFFLIILLSNSFPFQGWIRSYPFLLLLLFLFFERKMEILGGWNPVFPRFPRPERGGFEIHA